MGLKNSKECRGYAQNIYETYFKNLSIHEQRALLARLYQMHLEESTKSKFSDLRLFVRARGRRILVVYTMSIPTNLGQVVANELNGNSIVIHLDVSKDITNERLAQVFGHGATLHTFPNEAIHKLRSGVNLVIVGLEEVHSSYKTQIIRFLRSVGQLQSRNHEKLGSVVIAVEDGRDSATKLEQNGITIFKYIDNFVIV